MTDAVPPAPTLAPMGASLSIEPIVIGLSAVIVAVDSGEPEVLVVGDDGGDDHGLPFGPFDPIAHRTFEIGLRAWVKEQTGLDLGYVEQLYTFGDRGRHMRPGDAGPHVVSVGYLALTRAGAIGKARSSSWRPWYGFFPWEDFRNGRPKVIDEVILPALEHWAQTTQAAQEPPRALGRRERVALAFPQAHGTWDEEKVLERYELLYEAGLIDETSADGRDMARPIHPAVPGKFRLGQPMRFDHRRILATAISRLRSKIKYRPVVFEAMPESFSLTALQRIVEAISGRHLHKQNFRRLVETGALVEPTGQSLAETGGRPAQLFRFRREVLQERPAPGVRLGRGS